jgi:hypothetical protein
MIKLLAVIFVSFVPICFAADEPNSFMINKLIGRGINIGNALECPNEGDWGVKLEEYFFEEIGKAGFDSSADKLVNARRGPAAIYDRRKFFQQGRLGGEKYTVAEDDGNN